MTVKPLIFAACLLFMSACGRFHEAKLVHPETGATANCTAHGAGFIDRMTATQAFDDCIKRYEAQGYVRQPTE